MNIPTISYKTTCALSLIIMLSIACKDDNSTINPQLPAALCNIQEETTALAGNEKLWNYEYDDSGSLVKIKQLSVRGVPTFTTTISGGLVVTKSEPIVGVPPTEEMLVYIGGADMEHPEMVKRSTADDDLVLNEYWVCSFSYDTKGRLVTVSYTTPKWNGDLEYDLKITYNDQDNVTSLYYDITTGMAGSGSSIKVKSYDDKSTPYSAIPAWKFYKFGWDSSDPASLITALSKNNPTEYVLNEASPSPYSVTMSYEYNDEGMPVKKSTTNKNANGEYTFGQTYSYNCK